MNKKLTLGYSVVFTALLTINANALAEMTPISGAAAAAADDSKLDEIIVTARKQSESILKVPVAASALSAADLGRSGATDLLSLSGAIPSVSLDISTGTGGSYTVRGIGSSVTDGGAEQSVAMVLDGVQTARGALAQLGLLDLAQVEVLKGPQALYFGKNSPAGVIALTSKGPTDKLDGYIKTGYEFNAKEKMIEGAISGPITDTLRVRLAARYSDLSGWTENTAVATPNPFAAIPGNAATLVPAKFSSNAQKNAIGRLTVEYKPIDDFVATLRILGSQYKDNGPTASAETICPGAHPDLFGIPDASGDCRANGKASWGGVPPQLVGADPLFKDTPYDTIDTGLASLTLDYTTGPVQLTSVTGYLNYNWKQLQTAPTIYAYPLSAVEFKFHQFSEEVRAVTRLDSPVNFSGGIYFESNRFSAYAPNAILPELQDPSTGNYFDYIYEEAETGKSYSAFGQARWAIAEQWELDAGARYSVDQRTNKLLNSYVNPNSPLPLLAEGVVLSGDKTFHNLSPEVSLNWKPENNTLVYGSYRTGYKAGGATSPELLTTTSAAAPIFYTPEKIHGFELGAKTLTLNERLRVTAAVYDYTYKNLQIANFNSQTFVVQPLSGDVKTKGVELESAFRLTRQLTLNGGVGYSRARYSSFSGVACYSGQTAAAGCVAGTQNLTGQQKFRSPNWTGNVGFDYKIPVSSDYYVSLNGGMRFSSSFFSQENNNPAALRSAYQEYNAGMRFGAENGRWGVDLIGRNLSNVYVPSASYDLPNSIVPGSLLQPFQRPRQIALQVTAHL